MNGGRKTIYSRFLKKTEESKKRFLLIGPAFSGKSYFLLEMPKEFLIKM